MLINIWKNNCGATNMQKKKRQKEEKINIEIYI